MQRYFGAACAFAIAMASGGTRADDSSAALGMGGLAFTQSQAIRMADEDLRVSPKEVRIRFAFVNDSGKDIDTLVGFPLPDIDTMEFSNSPIGTITNDPVNFVGFAVKADGHPVAVSVEQRAFLNGRDVTAAVKSVGLPVNVIGEGSYKQLEALSSAQRKVLSSAGLAEFDDQGNAFPHWIVRTRFYWRQHFPASKTVVLEQSYQPVTGQSMFGPLELSGKSDDSDYYAKNFCLDEGARATLARMTAESKKANPQEGGYLNAYTTNYILSTGNNWKGPIGRFHLTLDKLAPGNVLSLCWDGKLKRTSATTFEDTRTDFSPRSDIKLLVIEPRKPAK